MDRNLNYRFGGVIRMEDKQKASYWFLFVADAIGIILAYLFAYYIRFYIPLFKVAQMRFATLEDYVKLLLFLVPVYLLIYERLRVYSPKLMKDSVRELIRLLLTNILSIICFLIMLYIMRVNNISRLFIVIFFVINMIFGLSIRVLCSLF